MYACDYLENGVLNALRGITFAAPAKCYLALYINNPGESGTAGTEVSYPGYKRMAIDFSAPADSNGGTGIQNLTDITFLSALFSVATPLAGPYIWRTDTSVYPWRLSLKRLDTTGRPEMYVRRRHNMTSYHRGKDPQNIVTRLYPLGYGEGVNQLGIGSVNGGVP